MNWVVWVLVAVLREVTSTERPWTPSRILLGGGAPMYGEVIVSSAALTVQGPPKGYPLIRRKQRDVTISPVQTTQLVDPDESEARGKKKQGKSSMMKKLKKMWPYMLVPTMMTLGYAPFLLSSLKMFVMMSMMVNMMAFNAAIFLTLRNMVFGPRNGQHVKYVNYGYNHKKKVHHRR